MDHKTQCSDCILSFSDGLDPFCISKEEKRIGLNQLVTSMYVFISVKIFSLLALFIYLKTFSYKLF